MSNYYDYRDVGVKIAHRLFKLNGWKVYGYKPDKSDLMTDYWDPAWWKGVAEKNGYTFVFNIDYEEKETITKVLKSGEKLANTTVDIDKINKLKKMTVKNGASEEEEKSAKKSIEKILAKQKEKSKENEDKFEEVTIPGHMANPPRCNWHIEKNGNIIEKGNGLLKFSGVMDITDERNLKTWQEFNNLSESEWKEREKTLLKNSSWNANDSDEQLEKQTNYRYENVKKSAELLEKFNEFINRIDTACGGLVGNKQYEYKKETVTKYKTVNVVKEKDGELKEGQCFVTKVNFNYGINRGYVYRIHKSERGGYYAYRLNGKLQKEFTGMANRANYWNINTANFEKWLSQKAIAFCEIVEEKEAYTEEKIVKKPVNNKSEKENNTMAKNKTNKANETNNVKENESMENAKETIKVKIVEDKDTRTDEKIYVLKISDRVSREEYININESLSALGGYYSRYKHGFIFKENIADKLDKSIYAIVTDEEKKERTKTKKTESKAKEKKEEKTEKMEEKNDDVSTFKVVEDVDTRDNSKIWVVKIIDKVSKQKYLKINEYMRSIGGYYSRYKHGFIFKEDVAGRLDIAI